MTNIEHTPEYIKGEEQTLLEQVDEMTKRGCKKCTHIHNDKCPHGVDWHDWCLNCIPY